MLRKSNMIFIFHSAKVRRKNGMAENHKKVFCLKCFYVEKNEYFCNVVRSLLSGGAQEGTRVRIPDSPAAV